MDATKTLRSRQASGILTVCLLLAFLLSPVQAGVKAGGGAVPSGQRLRTLAGSFLIGYASASNFAGLPNAALYQETARTEFNIVTPENDLKFGIVHPQQNTYNFAPADTHFQFAQANNMAFHGHTLIWHNQNPEWLTNGSWTPATLTAVMNDHIDTVMNHYPDGAVLVWDVVNEAFQDGSGQLRSSVWLNTLGQQYIEMAFRRARMNDSQTKLIYNDFNIETLNSKSDAVFAMVSDFRNRGVPIDGVGFQMHLTSGGIDGNNLAQNMARFANLGLEIYITEMDVRYATPISDPNLTAQANVYRTVLDRCRAQPMCKALQAWGFTDAHSWIPGTFPGTGDALLFDAGYNAKPAYFALQAGLGGGITPTPTRTTGPTLTPTRTPVGPTLTPTRTSTPSTPVAGVVNRVRFFPRASFANRMVGGIFQGSNTSTTAGFVNLATITTQPAQGVFTELTFTNSTAYRYVRYLSPNNGFGNVAEVEFYSGTTRLTGTGFGTAGSWQNGGNTFDRALDGNTATFFDGATGNGNFVGIDTGTTGPTATPTRTNTATNTPVGPTNTPTRTNTATNTPVGPTNTPTRTPTRTNTPVVGATCTVTYTVNDWNNGQGGFTGNVTITNNGASAINGWTLAWTFANQRVDQGWEATITQPGGAGTAVSAVNLSHNATIGPNGGSRAFGFNATYFGANPRPATFTLNGTACTVN